MYECAFTSKNGLADDSRRFIHAICKGRNDDAASSVDFVSRRRVKCESSITRRSMFCSMVIFFQDSSLQNVDKVGKIDLLELKFSISLLRLLTI